MRDDESQAPGTTRLIQNPGFQYVSVARSTVNQFVESPNKCQGGSLADTKSCMVQSTAALVLTPSLYQYLK